MQAYPFLSNLNENADTYKRDKSFKNVFLHFHLALYSKRKKEMLKMTIYFKVLGVQESKQDVTKVVPPCREMTENRPDVTDLFR